MNARVVSLVCVAVLALSACVQATPEEQVTGKNERCCKANPITKTCIDKRGGKKCAFLINNKGYSKGKCGTNCNVKDIIAKFFDPEGKNERCCKADQKTKTCIDKKGGKKCDALISKDGYTKGICGVNCIVGPTPDPNGKNERCCKANPVTRTCIDKKGGKKCALLIATQGYNKGRCGTNCLVEEVLRELFDPQGKNERCCKADHKAKTCDQQEGGKKCDKLIAKSGYTQGKCGTNCIVQVPTLADLEGKNERCCRIDPLRKTCIDVKGEKKCNFLIKKEGYTKGRCGTNCFASRSEGEAADQLIREG